MVKKGVVRVRVVALAEGRKTPKGVTFRRIPALEKGEFYFQVGSFKNYANAVRLRERLARRFSSVVIEPFSSPEGTFYRVKIFLAYDLKEARRRAESLRREFPQAFLVAR